MTDARASTSQGASRPAHTMAIHASNRWHAQAGAANRPCLIRGCRLDLFLVLVLGPCNCVEDVRHHAGREVRQALESHKTKCTRFKKPARLPSERPTGLLNLKKAFSLGPGSYSTSSPSAWKFPITMFIRSPRFTTPPLFEKAIQ